MNEKMQKWLVGVRGFGVGFALGLVVDAGVKRLVFAVRPKWGRLNIPIKYYLGHEIEGVAWDNVALEWILPISIILLRPKYWTFAVGFALGAYTSSCLDI